jgi:DNA-binding MarR family transcriptional regulator
MLSKKEIKKFYPQLCSRILLFLRQQRYHDGEILTEDLIKKFNTSKSRISQTLSFLTNQQYITRNYVTNLNNQGSRHKISLTLKGLGVAEALLSEGLDPLEKKVIEALKNRSNNLIKNKVSFT